MPDAPTKSERYLLVIVVALILLLALQVVETVRDMSQSRSRIDQCREAAEGVCRADAEKREQREQRKTEGTALDFLERSVPETFEQCVATSVWLCVHR
jgi:hypothetical protein